MSRGRLIRPLFVDVAVADKAASAANRDDDHRTFNRERPFGARGPVTDGVSYGETIRLKAQVEETNINRRTGSIAGNVPDFRTSFVVHFSQLESLGLVDATTGKVLLEGAKVIGIYNRSGAVVRLFDTPPVHVTELRHVGFGLGGKRNLLLLVTDDRPQGLEAKS